MDRLHHSDLLQLIDANSPPFVSLYLPTHTTGPSGKQDEIRLKNLTDRAEEQLAENWLRAPEARELLTPIRELPNDPVFWGQRQQGLAIFLNAMQMRTFRVPLRFDEAVYVGHRFHIGPLIPMVGTNESCFILQLSQHCVRLVQATSESCEEIVVPNLPKRIERALNIDDVDPGSQSHFAKPGVPGKESSVFHGQGGVKESHKEELTQFLRLVDDAIQPVLRDGTTPIILVGVDYVLSLFRQLSHYSHLADEGVTGNYDHASLQELAAKAWPVFESMRSDVIRKTIERFQDMAGTGLATDDIGQLLPAALEGRIQTMVVPRQVHTWGKSDLHGRVLETHDLPLPGDDDLSDVAIAAAIKHGAEVQVCNDGESRLRAIMRY